MFDLFKTNRINKITSTHTEKISDNMILMNIVNSQDAKKNLTSDEFKSYYETFRKISKRRDEIPTNALQYQHRAFSIAYEFEWYAGVPYEKICGDATDILYMYSNIKPKFEELMNDLINQYSEIINTLINENGLSDEEFKVRSYAIEFFIQSTATVILAYTSLRFDFFTKFVYEMAYMNMNRGVAKDYIKGEKDLADFRTYIKRIDDIHKEAYDNNDSLDKYIQNFTNSFMFLAGASDDRVSNASIVNLLDELKQIGESETT